MHAPLSPRHHPVIWQARHLASGLSQRLRSFCRDETGVITVESLFVAPTLIITFLLLFVYWDAFRARTASVRATYTVADMISRENMAVNNAFIDGMHRVFRYMINSQDTTWMRVSSVRYLQDDDRFEVLWSRSTAPMVAPAFNHLSIQGITPWLPQPANNDSLLVVETWRRYNPALSIGLEQTVFHEFSVVRPRFLSPLPIS